MKRIVLVDRSLTCVNLILSKTDCEIVVLVIDNSNQDVSSIMNNNRIGRIVTVAELDALDSIDRLDFSIIQRCKGTQLLAENAMTRYTCDYSERKYRYYMGLSFWQGIFAANEIDIVLINDLVHGFIYDGVLSGIAKEYDVFVYTVNPWGIHDYERSIFCENTREHIKLYNNRKLEKIEDYYTDGNFNVLNYYTDGNFNVLNYHKSDSVLKDLLKRKIKKFSIRAGGMIFLSFLQNIRKFTFLCKRIIASSGFKATFFDRLYSICKMKVNARYLTSIEKECSLDCNYIYFSLHFEPEGTIQTRCTLENQLICIKMLSETVPSGFKIYVKEHPHQFLINDEPFYSCYVPGVERFKTKYFYEKINAMKNVELVSRKYSAKEMIGKSRAVASLVGSCLFEAITEKKIILLFSECHPLVYNKEVLKCFSMQDCHNNMKKIKEGYLPDYTNILDFLSQYIASSQEELSDNVIKLLNSYEEIRRQS